MFLQHQTWNEESSSDSASVQVLSQQVLRGEGLGHNADTAGTLNRRDERVIIVKYLKL